MPSIPGDVEVSSSYLFEEFLRILIIEGELAIEHGVEQHSHRPHVTGFSIVRIA